MIAHSAHCTDSTDKMVLITKVKTEEKTNGGECCYLDEI